MNSSQNEKSFIALRYISFYVCAITMSPYGSQFVSAFKENIKIVNILRPPAFKISLKFNIFAYS